ncbi:hypothetical protein LIER_27719 [Lithospermum erythrorhizon]|uniref:DUF7734 domain-containing protein n=1 Tax=Lithospermum erythrorhizon TaxID=34254 RepID=A0AAV3RJ26_LITER
MSRPLGIWTIPSLPHHQPSFCNYTNSNYINFHIHHSLFSPSHSSSNSSNQTLIKQKNRFPGIECSSRRRTIRENNYDEEEREYNKEIEMLEMYTQFAKDEVLLVKAVLDDEEIEVIIFKGFSSCLSYKTSPNPSESVVPERAIIKSIDRIKGPFDPSNIEYLEQGLTWMDFKTRIQQF